MSGRPRSGPARPASLPLDASYATRLVAAIRLLALRVIVTLALTAAFIVVVSSLGDAPIRADAMIPVVPALAVGYLLGIGLLAHRWRNPSDPE